MSEEIMTEEESVLRAARWDHIRFVAGNILGRVVIWTLLLVGSALFLAPLLWMFNTSLTPEQYMYDWPPKILPLTLNNYVEAWNALPTAQMFRNSFVFCALVILGTLLSCTIVAYGFSRLRFPGRDILFIVLLSTMMLPGQVTMIPLYIGFSRIGWVPSYKPLIVPSFFGNAFFIFLLRQFFSTIPSELDDAARIDGCSRLGILYRVILPLSVPVLGVLTIFSFNGTWNRFLGPLIYLQHLEDFPIALGLRAFQTQYSTEMGWLMAMSILMTTPQIVIFFFAQRQMIQGVVLTGIKG